MKQSYYNPDLIKVNCDSETLYNIIKKYKFSEVEKIEGNQEVKKTKNIKENTYKYKILTKSLPENFNPNFTELEIVKQKENKYFQNPFKNWGPKGRAKEVEKK